MPTAKKVLNDVLPEDEVVVNAINYYLVLDAMKRLARQRQNSLYIIKSELERWIKLLE